MPLATGTLFGPYEVLSLLGAGGMGEVYRARDTRLGRDVALKILHAQSSSDTDRQRRFAQEARAISALNHPNILTVHDIGMESGIAFIVAELVDGETLKELIGRGAVPLRRGLEMAVQIADALAAAHRTGIVHRDLKPANIMITKAGLVKILDFGLAKSMHALPAVGETSPGFIVGTANYMSPEQARGEAVDVRSDQFSFGLILYEMLTGVAPFVRETPISTIAAILNAECPPLAEVKPSVPAPLRWCVERCLAKDREGRYSSTEDLATEVRLMRERLPELSGVTAVPAVPGKPAGRWRSWAAAATVVVLVGAAAAPNVLAPPTVNLDRYRVRPLATAAHYEGSAAWSADGRSIAFAADVDGTRQIFVRELDSPMEAQITRGPVDCEEPFWSADGTRLYFYAGSNLLSVPATGGVSDIVQKNMRRAALSPDGRFLAFLRQEDGDSGRLTLWMRPAQRADAKQIAAPLFAGTPFVEGHLRWTPDGAEVGAWLGQWNGRGEFWLISASTGAVRRGRVPATGARPFSWMPGGRHLVFGGILPGTVGADLHTVDVERGDAHPITKTTSEATWPAVSRDGRRIAFSVAEADYDIVNIALGTGQLSPVLATSRDEYSPAWSPTGNRLGFVTDRSGVAQIWTRNEQDRWERPLITGQEFGSAWVASFSDLSFSPDGERLAYSVEGSNGHAIYLSNVRGSPPVRLNQDDAHQRFPSWSPDGAALAYVQNVNGQWSLVSARSSGDAPPKSLYRLSQPCRTRWSPRGDGIACATPAGLVLVSPDGREPRPISRGNWEIYGWNQDGTRIHGIQRTTAGQRRLVTLDAATGREIAAVPLALPRSTGVRSFALAPGGTAITTAISQPRADLWLLEGFPDPRPHWRRLLSGQ